MDAKYQIANLDMKDGDILVVKLNRNIPSSHMDAIRHQLSLVTSNKVVFLSPDFDISIIRKDQIDTADFVPAV